MWKGPRLAAIAILTVLALQACEHLKAPTSPPGSPGVPQHDIPWPSLANSPWPMHHGNPQSTGRSPYTGPNGPTTKWAVEFPGGVGSVVIGSDSTLYFPISYELVDQHQESFLYAAQSDGTIKWKFPLQQPPFPTGGAAFTASQPLVGADGTIYIGAPNGNFYAVNPNGTLRWKFKADAAINMPGINIGLDGALYFVAADNRLYAVNPDGTLRWKTSVEGGFRDSESGIAFSTTGQSLYLPGHSEYGAEDQTKFFALNLNGEVQWEFLAGGEVFTVPMVDSDGNIYFAAVARGASRSRFYSLTPDGDLRWQIELQGFIANDPTLDRDGNIYFDTQSSLVSVDHSGKLRWQIPLVGVTGSLVCDQRNRVYGFASGIFAVAPSGEILWATDVPTLAFASPAIDAMGTLYMGTWFTESPFAKVLYALGQK